jgi:hypothetical protein
MPPPPAATARGSPSPSREQQHPRRHRRHRRTTPGPPSGTRARSGTTSWLLDLQRRGRQDRVHGLRVEEGPGRHRPADRPPGPQPEQEGSRRAGRAVPRLALPRGLHRLAVRAGPGRRTAPRHAVVEQVFADVTSGPLAHMLSGVFAANGPGCPSRRRHTTWSARPARWLACLRQSTRGDDPPRPDRDRSPRRPPRQGPPHPAPARRLAPRTGRAEPVGRGLRPARGSGPDQTRTGQHPDGPAATQNPCAELGTPDKSHGRRAAGYPRRNQLAKLLVQESSRNGLPELAGGSS